jgi:hypothetical protein
MSCRLVPLPGNINQLMLKLSSYVPQLATPCSDMLILCVHK